MFVFIWILNLFKKIWQRVVEAAARGSIKLWELGFGAGDGDAAWTQLMRDFGQEHGAGGDGVAEQLPRGLQLPAPNEGWAAFFMQVLRCCRWMAEELTGRATNPPRLQPGCSGCHLALLLIKSGQ